MGTQAGPLSNPQGNWTPNGNSVHLTDVGNAAVLSALPGGSTVVFVNSGTAEAYISLGAVDATSASFPLQAGDVVGMGTGGQGKFSAITGSGTTNIDVFGGVGLFVGGASGGGGGTSSDVSVTGGNVGISSLPALPSGNNTIGNVGVAGTVTALPSGTTTVSGAVTVSGAAVTPSAGTNTVIATGGTAVTIIGANAHGGWITNADTVNMFIDPVGVAGTVAGGTTFLLAPAQTFVAIPGSVNPVTGNSTKSSHAFSSVKW